MSRELSPVQLIERSIQKKYRKELWSPFIAAVKRYALIQAGDRIAVCVSGGKDSMLLAKLMQLLKRHSDVPFELEFIVMDPGYNPENRRQIEANAALLGVQTATVQPGEAAPLIDSGFNTSEPEDLTPETARRYSCWTLDSEEALAAFLRAGVRNITTRIPGRALELRLAIQG